MSEEEMIHVRGYMTQKQRDRMRIGSDLARLQAQKAVESLGGELLAGSGFEEEEPAPEFTGSELVVQTEHA